MADILLANSFLYPLDKKQWKNKQPYPPLGTLYAASVLDKEGYSLVFQDHCLSKDLTQITDYIRNQIAPILVIYEDGFNYLTKMCLSVMRDVAFEMIQVAKQHGLTVIISSSDATDQFESYHRVGVDYVIHGEGELTLLALIGQLKKEGNVYDIPGISYLHQGEVIKTSPKPVLSDLDSLPMPAWHLIDYAAYKAVWLEKTRPMELNIATTRGCPFKCNWCAKPIYGNRYNSRSVKNVVAEIAYLVENFGVDYFWFCDDIFGLRPGWVQEFSQEINSQGLKIRFKIQSRVDLLLQEDTIDALIESGLDIVWVGAESGSQKILDAMDKGTQVEQIYQATEILRKKGAKIGFFLQFGYLTEDKSDIQKTIEMVLDLMPDEIGVSVSYPLPGTGFYDRVKQDLLKKSNWTDSDDLDVMYESKYPKAFYRKLHRYLHYRYRVKRGLTSLQLLAVAPSKFRMKQFREVASMLYHWPKLMTGSRLLQ
ncbi:MAG: B12-binding domain-containing radical SAM protein [Saprospiraceae bacterium]|nr:B12-binding domain-containing radical SAM protein [Saprospiraceae bacterium]